MYRLKFFYDIISPYSYIAFKCITRSSPSWASKVAIDHQPIYLGGIMKRSDNNPPGLNPLKARYMTADLQHCKKYYDVNLVLPQNMVQLFFNRSTIDALRMLRIVKQSFGGDKCERVANLFFDHIWLSDGTTEGNV